MSNTLLRIIALILVAAALVACTRDRETPTPTPPATTPVAAQSLTVTGTQSGGADPVVEMTTGTATPQPSEAEPTEAETNTPEPTSTAQKFDYTVEPGETLASIAGKFLTDVQTLRELNFLLDDNIFAGQILEVPWQEGITYAGMPTPSPTPFSYVVQQGDTLSSIAFQFDVQPGVLIEVNNILDPNNLIVGTPLLIPGYTSAETAVDVTDDAVSEVGGATGASVTHVVQPGETMGQIAAEYGIDPVALAEANNIANGNLIRVGQQLVIPGVSERQALEARGERHIVQSGESLSMIASQYGVSVEAILAANALDDPNTIVVGQELLIPPAD